MSVTVVTVSAAAEDYGPVVVVAAESGAGAAAAHGLGARCRGVFVGSADEPAFAEFVKEHFGDVPQRFVPWS